MIIPSTKTSQIISNVQGVLVVGKGRGEGEVIKSKEKLAWLDDLEKMVRRGRRNRVEAGRQEEKKRTYVHLSTLKDKC
jgi:hypothetical protein